MQKLAAILAMTLVSITISAQTAAPSLKERCDKLEQRVTSLENQIAGMSQRMSKIENDNVYYRQMLDYGKAITECDGKNGTHYKLLSVTGNKKDKTVFIKMQMSTTVEGQELQFRQAEAIELSGDPHKTYEVIGESLFKQHTGMPRNLVIKFEDIDPVKCQKLKGLIVNWYYTDDENRFENLNIDWK